jgi:hypothetical protein
LCFPFSVSSHFLLSFFISPIFRDKVSSRQGWFCKTMLLVYIARPTSLIQHKMYFKLTQKHYHKGQLRLDCWQIIINKWIAYLLCNVRGVNCSKFQSLATTQPIHHQDLFPMQIVGSHCYSFNKTYNFPLPSFAMLHQFEREHGSNENINKLS